MFYRPGLILTFKIVGHIQHKEALIVILIYISGKHKW